MIKGGLPAYEKIEPRLPQKLKAALDKYSNQSKSSTHEKKVSAFVKKQLITILLYSVILTALALLSFLLLKPLLNNLFNTWEIPIIWSNLIGMSATLLLMSPFLWALAVKNVSHERIRKMLQTYRNSQVAVIPLLVLRYFITLFFVLVLKIVL